MLTRRHFLTTIAAAPLAAFCRTEPVRLLGAELVHRNPLGPPDGHVVPTGEPFWFVRNHDGTIKTTWRPCHIVLPKDVVERRYALPQGTLG